MKISDIHSLGRQTDLIFADFSGEIVERDSYIAIKTRSNPSYHWGNYLIFDQAPRKGDLAVWRSIFDREFDFLAADHHYTFTWNCRDNEQIDISEFQTANYEFDTGFVLTTKKVKLPPKFNSQVRVRKITTAADWEAVVQNGILCADPKFFSSVEKCEEFERSRTNEYREMAMQGLGDWFGAFLDDRLVADLGIFHRNQVARYQNVGTHPEFRRQGICGTLVYESAKIAFTDYGVKDLVMEADADYHATAIYESVGFQKTEKNHSLSWWKRS